MIKLKDLLREGKMGSDYVNQALKDMKNPKELARLIIDMSNANEDSLFMSLYTNIDDPKVHKALFDAIKQDLKRYSDGIV